jgi:hypothetical protein
VLEVQSDLEVLDQNLNGLMEEIKQLLHEQDNVEQQLDCMRKGRGLRLWPIPHVNDPDFTRSIPVVIKPCGYCNMEFQNFDVALTSCKHAFHPFCLCVMMKAGSTCFICREPLHPNWWSSWGFREPDENTKKLAKELNLQDLRRATLENIISTARAGLNSKTSKSYFFIFLFKF